MPAVEKEQVELLVVRVAEPRMEVPEHVLRPADRVAGGETPLREPPAELEGREQARGLGGADAGDAFELGRKRATERGEAELAEQLLRQGLRAATARAGAEQQRQELRIVEMLGAAITEAFPRPGTFA